MRIDGDAARAARREARNGDLDYVLAGEVFELPPELPLIVTDIEQQALDEKWELRRYYVEMVKLLLGDEAWQRLWSTCKPSYADLKHLWGQALEAYSVDQGESPSSPDSSATGGERSKRRSSASTKSTRARSGQPAAAEPVAS